MIQDTKIVIDLADELTANELESFIKRAEEAGSKDLTEHFKRVFLNLPECTQLQPQPTAQP